MINPMNPQSKLHPVATPWHDLSPEQKAQAKRDGLDKPTHRGARGREIIEPGWLWLVNPKTGKVLKVLPRDEALGHYR